MTTVTKDIFNSEVAYRAGAFLFRLFFAALFLFAAINSTSQGISVLASDLARDNSQAIARGEWLSYAYFFILAALFTTGSLLLLFQRKVLHVYVVAGSLYLTYTIWQISTGTSPTTADQYVPTIFGFFIAFLLEEKSVRVPSSPPPSSADASI